MACFDTIRFQSLKALNMKRNELLPAISFIPLSDSSPIVSPVFAQQIPESFFH
jgi:hypothetical protein